MASPTEPRLVCRNPQRRPDEADVKRTYEHLLATATKDEHRVALRLLPRFRHLSMREAYIAAMEKVARRHSERC
jgi:hypothetical protein